MNKKPTNTRAPSRDQLTSTYTELNIREVETLINIQTDGLDPTYSQLNIRQNELVVAKDEDPPVASGLGEMPVTAQAGPHKQEPDEQIGITSCHKICLLSLVTIVLFAVVVGLSIHVSQIRQSLKRMNSDLRHHFTEMETKYRSVNKTKAQICEFLTSRREQSSSKNWVTNKDRSYYVSKFDTSFQKAIQECSKRQSRLLEINSNDEARFVFHNLLDNNLAYWIEMCENGRADSPTAT
ncbi:C-type lectin domain family 9 member A-like isoform X2 [Hypanus sabinus]|uniref:C-type lectin domain family 9 member A-like isoform X2 n=1 Tax=Hypanus sabinus TaxID=79690 RepID=UPI0028C4045B|nr:C-type lectin domain family 9 member A-like isoform X2 [Hypanus sabinus]